MQDFVVDRREPAVWILLLLVTPSRSVYDLLTQALDDAGVAVWWEQSLEGAVRLARANRHRVLVVTADCDWRSLLDALSGSVEHPNIVLLTYSPDPELWAMAHKLGIFEVLPADGGVRPLVQTVLAANSAWERRQQVYAARLRNAQAKSHCEFTPRGCDPLPLPETSNRQVALGHDHDRQE